MPSAHWHPAPMRRVQTLPGLLSTGPEIDTIGGHHHADASILSEFLSDDAVYAVQETVEPTVIALTGAQITQLEHDIMAKLNITEQVYAVLQNDTQEALEALHASLLAVNVPNNSFDGVESALHESFEGKYKVTMTIRKEGPDDENQLHVLLKLTQKIGNTKLEAKTKAMMFSSSVESGAGQVQYTAMIGPAGYAIPSENAQLNTSNMRMFGPDTPL